MNRECRFPCNILPRMCHLYTIGCLHCDLLECTQFIYKSLLSLSKTLLSFCLHSPFCKFLHLSLSAFIMCDIIAKICHFLCVACIYILLQLPAFAICFYCLHSPSVATACTHYVLPLPACTIFIASFSAPFDARFTDGCFTLPFEAPILFTSIRW